MWVLTETLIAACHIQLQLVAAATCAGHVYRAAALLLLLRRLSATFAMRAPAASARCCCRTVQLTDTLLQSGSSTCWPAPTAAPQRPAPNRPSWPGGLWYTHRAAFYFAAACHKCPPSQRSQRRTRWGPRRSGRSGRVLSRAAPRPRRAARAQEPRLRSIMPGQTSQQVSNAERPRKSLLATAQRLPSWPQ